MQSKQNPYATETVVKVVFISFEKNKWVFKIELGLNKFRFTVKLSRKYRVKYTPFPHAGATFLATNIHCQSDTFVTISDPTLTHYYHPKLIVYI